MTNVLLLVHVENMFRSYFPDEMFVPRLIRACRAKKYSLVIHFTSGVNDYHPIEEIRYLVDLEVDWSWGYEPAMFEHDPDELGWLIGSGGHEYTWVPPELRDGLLDGVSVYLGGGCDGECLTNMEAVLEYLGIPFERVPGYIY